MGAPERLGAEVEYGAAIAGSVVRLTAGDRLTGDLAARAAALGRVEALLDVKFRTSRDRADEEAIILFEGL
jgi:hypothetical protein